MKILGVETSGTIASVAVTDGDKLVCECILNNRLTHSQKLMPMIDNVLKDSALTLDDIDVIAVSVGPGSFTGLRIGVATVKGFAHALGKHTVAVSSLESLAYNVCHSEFLICPIIDARNEQVYTALYENKDDLFISAIEPCTMYVSELIEILASKARKIIFVGDGIGSYREIISSILNKNAVFAHSNLSDFRGSSLCICAGIKANNGEYTPYEELSPVYLRKPQAQRELERRNK